MPENRITLIDLIEGYKLKVADLERKLEIAQNRPRPEFESVVLKGMQADLTAARKATEEYAGALDKLSIEYDKLKNTNTALESSRKDWEDKGFTIDPTDKDIIWECYRRKLFVLAEVQAP